MIKMFLLLVLALSSCKALNITNWTITMDDSNEYLDTTRPKQVFADLNTGDIQIIWDEGESFNSALINLIKHYYFKDDSYEIYLKTKDLRCSTFDSPNYKGFTIKGDEIKKLERIAVFEDDFTTQLAIS